jgi:hypothetical protein
MYVNHGAPDSSGGFCRWRVRGCGTRLLIYGLRKHPVQRSRLPNYALVEAIIKLFSTQRLTVNVVFELINRELLITDYAFDKIAD